MPTTTDTRVPVGGFYVNSWGYDQTNVDFYRVVAHTAKCVKVQRWTKVVRDAYAPCAYATPGDGPAMVTKWAEDGSTSEQVPAPIETKRPDPRHGWLHVNSYSHAGPWDGTPQYQTGHGWGH
jgi:hypothetical protein